MDETMRSALGAISDVYVQQGASPGAGEGAERRWNLRSALEARTLALHSSFLKEFAEVAEQFERVAADVDQLSLSCASMSSALKQTRANSLDMTDQLAVLENEMEEAKAKEEQVKAFLARFHLTPEDKAVLHRDVTPQFFTVLEKVKDIHSHCVDLLNAQHQQAGIEVMEMTHIQQSQAYERLSRWVHGQTQAIMSHDTPDVPTIYVRAMNALKDRLPLWCACMKDIALIRRTALVRKLFTVLTSEGQASDPHRAVSNMLAWVHQSVAEEADLLNNFFAADSAAEPERPRSTPLLASMDTIAEVSRADLLDTVFEGTVKHIRQKVEQTLTDTASAGEQQALVAYFQLDSILQFYCTTIEALLGKNAVLTKALGELKLTTLKRFFDLLKGVSDSILQSPCAPSDGLGPPAVVYESLGKLRLMMDTLADSLTPPEEREAEFSAVLSGVVHPVLQVVERMQGLDALSHSVCTINCLCLLLATFAEQPFTRAKAAQIEEMMKRETGRVAGTVGEGLLRSSGLGEAVGAVRDHTLASEHGEAPPLASSSAAASAENVEDAARAFVKAAPTMREGLRLFEKVKSATLREQLTAQTLRIVADGYEEVWRAVAKPENGYPSGILPKTPAEVNAQLGLS